MLEPFIKPTIASYNFNISNCNCSERVLLLNRACINAAVYVRDIVYGHAKFHQQPIIEIYTASQNNFPELYAYSGNL